MATQGSDHVRYFEDIASLPSGPTRQVGYTFPEPPHPVTAQRPYQSGYQGDVPGHSLSPMQLQVNLEPVRSETLSRLPDELPSVMIPKKVVFHNNDQHQ